MSVRPRAPAHAYPRAAVPPAAVPPLIVLLLIGMAAGAASAERPPATTALTRAEAARSGVAIALVEHPELPVDLIEVQLPDGSAASRLLDVAPDGALAAVADRIDLIDATLTLARADGSQLRAGLPGLLAGAFAPDGTWLAVLDGAGSLWSVRAADATRSKLADGPFLGPLTVEPAGTILLVRVASVEAPFTARLVRLHPADGSLTAIADDELVYGSSILADGSIAIVAHDAGATVVHRLTTSGKARLADLGPGAIHVAVSADGARIAWERHGDGVFLLELPGETPRRLAAGSHPLFATDGRSLLVHDDGGTALLALDGSVLARFAGPAAFLRCGGGCRP